MLQKWFQADFKFISSVDPFSLNRLLGTKILKKREQLKILIKTTTVIITIAPSKKLGNL